MTLVPASSATHEHNVRTATCLFCTRPWMQMEKKKVPGAHVRWRKRAICSEAKPFPMDLLMRATAMSHSCLGQPSEITT
jgi:hypothetical protein